MIELCLIVVSNKDFFVCPHTKFYMDVINQCSNAVNFSGEVHEFNSS